MWRHGRRSEGDNIVEGGGGVVKWPQRSRGLHRGSCEGGFQVGPRLEPDSSISPGVSNQMEGSDISSVSFHVGTRERRREVGKKEGLSSFLH